MSDWKLSFRHRKGSDIDIWVHSNIRYPKIVYHIRRIQTQNPCFHRWAPYFSVTAQLYKYLDVGYRIKVYSNIRYNVGHRSLQSDIGSSDIKLSLILVITDIGVSAHLWYSTLQKGFQKIPGQGQRAVRPQPACSGVFQSNCQGANIVCPRQELSTQDWNFLPVARTFCCVLCTIAVSSALKQSGNLKGIPSLPSHTVIHTSFFDWNRALKSMFWWGFVHTIIYLYYYYIFIKNKCWCYCQSMLTIVCL
jgi:hypothetical protein